jgi:hypothetical protein
MATTVKRRLCCLVIVITCMLSLTSCAGSPAKHAISLGVATDRVADLSSFASTVRAPVSIYEWYQAWDEQPAFDAARASASTAAGALPLLTWEPWAPGQGVDQPKFALARIVAGDFDAYIASFARQVRAWGGRLALRFAHEINGDWYPWGMHVNGNTPSQAVQAWDHVRAIFTEQGATNVVWVWCVNAARPGTSASYASLYPGDDEVDVVALDGYNGGTALPWGGWLTPSELFGPSLREMGALTRRPLIIAEVGSAEQGGDKAAWIAALFRLVQDSQVRALVWFDYDKEADWRVASSRDSVNAFRRASNNADISTKPPFLA